MPTRTPDSFSTAFPAGGTETLQETVGREVPKVRVQTVRFSVDRNRGSSSIPS